MTSPPDLEVEDASAPSARSSRSLRWGAGAVAALALIACGVWILLESTVPVSVHDEVVADLRAAEADLAVEEAERRVLAVELELLGAEMSQLETQLAERNAEAADRGGGFTFGSEERNEEQIEESEEARALFGPAKARLTKLRADRAGEAPFDLLHDSLCLWFTPEMMNDIVVVAQEESGARFDFEGFGRSDCRLDPGISARWYTSRAIDGVEESHLSIVLGRVRADHRRLLTQVEPDDFTSILRTGPLVSTVSTPDGSVAYGNLTYHGFDQGVSLQVRVVGHEDEVLFFDLGVYDREPPGWPTNYEWFAFEVIHLMLDHMGWIDCPIAGCSMSAG